MRICRAVIVGLVHFCNQVKSSCAGSGFSFAFSVWTGWPSRSNRVATIVVLVRRDHKSGDRARCAVNDLVVDGAASDGPVECDLMVGAQVDCDADPVRIIVCGLSAWVSEAV